MYKEELQGFPVEVVEKMLERQVEQGNKRDISVFEADRFACKEEGGFDWDETPEGWYFWYKVIDSKNFDHFFERYPDPQDDTLNVKTETTDPLEHLKQAQYHLSQYIEILEKQKQNQ